MGEAVSLIRNREKGGPVDAMLAKSGLSTGPRHGSGWILILATAAFSTLLGFLLALTYAGLPPEPRASLAMSSPVAAEMIYRWQGLIGSIATIAAGWLAYRGAMNAIVHSKAVAERREREAALLLRRIEVPILRREVHARRTIGALWLQRDHYGAFADSTRRRADACGPQLAEIANQIASIVDGLGRSRDRLYEAYSAQDSALQQKTENEVDRLTGDLERRLNRFEEVCNLRWGPSTDWDF